MSKNKQPYLQLAISKNNQPCPQLAISKSDKQNTSKNNVARQRHLHL